MRRASPVAVQMPERADVIKASDARRRELPRLRVPVPERERVTPPPDDGEETGVCGLFWCCGGGDVLVCDGEGGEEDVGGGGDDGECGSDMFDDFVVEI